MMKHAWKLWIVGAAATLAACGGPLSYIVRGTASAPEADGRVIADLHKSSSFSTIKVSLEHLAPPDRLGGGTTFVVWTSPDKAKWHRVGALSYDESGRKGELEGASVPVTSFALKVTVEKTPEPDKPSDTVIVEQQVN